MKSFIEKIVFLRTIITIVTFTLLRSCNDDVHKTAAPSNPATPPPLPQNPREQVLLCHIYLLS